MSSEHATDHLHVALGATGGVGSEAVRLLAAAGHRVRAVARQTPPTAPLENAGWMEADVATPDGAARAVAGAGIVILLERHARGDLRVTLGRASDCFGPTGNSMANAFGQPRHVPATSPLTGGDFARLAHRVAGIDAEPGLVTPARAASQV